MSINFKNILFVVCFCIYSAIVNAQYTPFFENFALTEFGAGNTNWGISLAENGKLYVANDKGLVEYDGLKWDFYQLPNKTIIRSVLAYNGVIYTGSYEEFGYWKKNSKGKLVYTTLSGFEERQESLAEEFWQIFHYNGAIFFRSFSSIYSYRDGVVKRIEPQSTILSCSIVDDIVYVATVRHGVFVLNNENLEPVIYHPLLYNAKVVSIDKYEDKLIIATALRGCFLYNNVTKQLMPWGSEINPIIKEQQLNSFKIFDDTDMFFGTIKNGVYITSKEGKLKYHINKENGLLNNTVLSHELGKHNELWIGLDNGIAKLDLDYNRVLYNDNTGRLGAVYDVINYKNRLYLGSNTGLFYLNKNEAALTFVEGSQGQVWDLKIVNKQLICGHNNGTFLVDDNQFIKISDFTGGWVLQKIPEQQNAFIQGTYGGLVKFNLSNNSWDAQHLGVKTIPTRYVVFENPTVAWVAHAYKGLFRVAFNEACDSIKSFKNYKDKGLWSDFNVKVHKIKNDICFKTNEGWQKYEAIIDSIVPHDILNTTFGVDTDIISEPDTDILVTKDEKDKISFLSLAQENIYLNIPKGLLQKRLVVDAESVSKLNDSIYTFNLYDGFMLINKTIESAKDTLHKPVIEQMEIDKELVNINEDNTYEFPFNKNISISVSSPLSKDHYFEYAIATSNALNWYRMEREKLELSGLSNGDYNVYFRTANFSGDVSEPSIFRIKILPPWYKNIFFYLLILLLLSGLFYGLHKRKINKEQKLLHDKLVKEQEVLLKEKAIENDKKIVQLRNQSLKSEVKLKSKQLANTAMALVKKNESMLEIKNELEKNKSGFTNALAYKRLLRKIDNSIGHEDEWELFEYNFNQVHEEFFNQLKSKHPKLTHKDLKVCAYIKMNLLTKEIAPLMNVSIRGLETHRYRLKRKLNLENDKSLTDYLQDFK
ncbi:regulatory LuxR family protein [Jejuia pallidilutea]|uniref:Regulatory LuxR family protein n=1 Tax=Jejuia pallidilutea TaxID=504487 RepID=A0A362X3W3_9FLAO|nr:LuxR C-terminal-related transcriptional regulator [Jejuia pallidilutea]PQV51427.1 regulatory LuxR family protein [Jejuia pallidilutea]